MVAQQESTLEKTSKKIFSLEGISIMVTIGLAVLSHYISSEKDRRQAILLSRRHALEHLGDALTDIRNVRANIKTKCEHHPELINNVDFLAESDCNRNNSQFMVIKAVMSSRDILTKEMVNTISQFLNWDVEHKSKAICAGIAPSDDVYKEKERIIEEYIAGKIRDMTGFKE